MTINYPFVNMTAIYLKSFSFVGLLVCLQFLTIMSHTEIINEQACSWTFGLQAYFLKINSHMWNCWIKACAHFSGFWYMSLNCLPESLYQMILQWAMYKSICFHTFPNIEFHIFLQSLVDEGKKLVSYFS